MYEILLDKSLPIEVLKNKGFTYDGNRYEGINYIYYRFLNQNIKIIATKTPALFLNNKVLNNLIHEKEVDKWLLDNKDKQ